jgi:hypothetical protein
MHLDKRIVLLLTGALLSLHGCDWAQGSTLSWSQTMTIWQQVDSGNCLTLGTYTFAQDVVMPPFDDKSSLQMKTPDKNDQESLPLFFDINYRLNGDPYYQHAFELKKGKGSIRQHQSNFWQFEEDDEIEYQICTGGGGTIPFGTQIAVRFDWKFDKPDVIK